MPEPLTLATPHVGRPAIASAELVGRSPAITRIQEFICRAGNLDGGVLITAEPGADVDSVAREIHARSRHVAGAYVIVECGGADPARLDRLLFGLPAPGGPTDLESVTEDSRLSAARGGVLFLQDVSELSAGAQARLARIARDGEVRIGGAPVETGFRLVGGATRGIDADVEVHRFRADLYRRLSAVRIDLPPLRDRAEDVPPLAERLLADLCAARDLPMRRFTQAALALLGALTWPGNLRELHDAIERVVSDRSEDVIQIEHLLPALRLQCASSTFTPSGNLREARLRFERDYIAAVLQHHGWHMAQAAQALGIQRPNLYRKARQLGIPLTRVHE
jgi:two-component system nitrogen regulation response regulator NtrX